MSENQGGGGQGLQKMDGRIDKPKNYPKGGLFDYLPSTTLNWALCIPKTLFFGFQSRLDFVISQLKVAFAELVKLPSAPA